MNKTKCVYMITTDFNDKVYIGVAEDFDRRMYQHAHYHDANHSYIDNSIREHGWEHYTAVIIDNYETDEERKELEQRYIKLYRAHRSENGYNLTWGGDDNCFPDTRGEKNPRAQFTEEDVRIIRERRMNGERLSDVFEDYKDKCQGNKRAGFSKIWLHDNVWLNVHPEFKGHYPPVDSSCFAAITKNLLSNNDYDYLTKYFKWNGPIPRYNTLYKTFKGKVDWETFQRICKEIVNSLYGSPDIRRTSKKNGKLQEQINTYRLELITEPIYS